MKKGLRRVLHLTTPRGFLNEHRPDEKGIATRAVSPLQGASPNEHRPDEKGIATRNPTDPTLLCLLRTNTDLMKKGLRPSPPEQTQT